MVIIVMGPPGAGKSTVGRALSQDLGWSFVDSDAGVEVHHAAARAVDRREHLVVACAAPTARARAIVRGDLRLRFVYLRIHRQVLEGRLERQRHGPPSTDLHAKLLEFEDPADEALAVDGGQEVTAIVGTIKRELGL